MSGELGKTTAEMSETATKLSGVVPELSETAEVEIAHLKRVFKELRGHHLSLIRGDPKDVSVALEEKIIGNNYSAKKNYDEALDHYNRGILFCPLDTGQEH
ncbi:hypothetical protein JTB14_021034 [Gonioctena quinquepunctata]|nr:hypothetical protein JTB14_021034 [Gonioctena quinquepunctata]